MKRILLFLLPACLFLNAFSWAQGRYPSISVKGGKLSVNGTRVDPGWKVSPLFKAMGSDFRRLDGYNLVYTYDAYGMVLYEKKQDERGTDDFNELQVYFATPQANKVTPTGLYRGSAKIEKLVLDNNTDAASVRAKLNKYSQSDSYSEHSFRLAYKGIYIYFLFDDSDRFLEKISIGPDRRKN